MAIGKMIPLRNLVCTTVALMLLAITPTAIKVYHITPNANECPLGECSTLGHVVQNPSRYFVSNTTFKFLSGNHFIASSSYIQIVHIASVSNIALIGNPTNKSVIYCSRTLLSHTDFGFAFINVTNVTIVDLKFVNCGTSKQMTYHEILKFTSDTLSPYLLFRNFFPNYPTIFLIQAFGVSISGLDVRNSSGPGLLGINTFGFHSISQSTFTSNFPNCVLIFLDPLNLQGIIPDVFVSIANTEFVSGTSSYHGAGLSVLFAQTKYNVYVSLENVIAHKNHGQYYGNLLFSLDSCNHQHVALQLNKVNCTNGRGSLYRAAGLALQIGIRRNCSKFQAHKGYIMNVSNGYFADNDGIGILLALHSPQNTGAIKLENILIQENVNHNALHIRNMPSVLLRNAEFVSNKAGALVVQQSSIQMEDINRFENNRAYWAAAVMLNSNATIKGNTCFLMNRAERGGALYAQSSTITLLDDAHVQFVENKGYDGGALSFHDSSLMNIYECVQVEFVSNHAHHYGGAIYVDDDNEYSGIFNFGETTCFYRQFPISNLEDRRLNFENNTADEAGSALFGGWVEICAMETLGNARVLFRGFSVFEHLFSFNINEPDLSLISSNPSRVCVCNASTPNCNITQYNITVYPGETFHIRAVAIGQKFGTVPTLVLGRFVSNNSIVQPTLENLQSAQRTAATCTKLSYTVKSPNKNETMLLTVERFDIPDKDSIDGYAVVTSQLPRIAQQFSSLYINVKLLSCPKGFIFESNSCICDHKLQQHDVTCDIDTQTVDKENPLWIYANDLPGGVIVHEHCPFDYCKPHSVNFSLEHPNEQCAYHRSNVLCGACQHGLSHVLGTSNCKECSNYWIMLFVSFLMFGIALTGLQYLST